MLLWQVGSINCQDEKSLCKELGITPSHSARVFAYTYEAIDKASLTEYNGDMDSRSLKVFCQNHLPRFSKRVDLSRIDFPSSTENLPRVMLLSNKKDTPVIWRALSGLYRKRFTFYDVEVCMTQHSSKLIRVLIYWHPLTIPLVD